MFANILPSLYKGICDDSGCNIHSLNQLPQIVSNVIQILLALITAIAVIFVIYGGIQYSISGGDSSKTAGAKTTILNAVIGVVLSSSAYLILSFITSKFN